MAIGSGATQVDAASETVGRGPAPLRIDHGGPYGARVVTLRALAAGDCVGPLSAGGGIVEAPHATRYSIQIGADHHVEHRGAFAFQNHSCAPNCILDTETRELVALRPVAGGEELTLFYPATEWDMAEPFACGCGALECLGRIAGARNVEPQRLRGYTVSSHIRELAEAVAEPRR
jgi:hypothetical protein